MPSPDTSALPDRADYVVVGAGMAGLYSAWRILDAHPSANIVILERLNRTGGRLHTDLIKVPLHDGSGACVVREEEGGMRFNYSMRELMALCTALKLCDDMVPFLMDGSNRRLEYRGQNFTQEQAQADPGIWSEIFNLNPAERDQSPVALLSLAYHRVLAANGVGAAPQDPTPEYWQKFRLEYSWKGTTLNNWQLWGLLRDMGYSEEAITMMAQSIGFQGPFLSLMNAGEAFQLLEDFPSEPVYYTFRDGYSTLPDALVRRLEAEGAQITLCTNVDAIAMDDNGFTLALTTSPDGENSAAHIPGGTLSSIQADNVILALPRKALERLFATSPALHRQPGAWQLHQDLLTTTNQQLLKLNLYYETPWWQNGLSGQAPITFGPSYTDLPLNSVYPFYALDSEAADSPAALTVYCDWNDVNFWRGLQNVGPLFDSPLQTEHTHEPYVLPAASEAVVAEATRQFGLLFNTDWVPRPVLTSFRAWDGESDNGFGVHQWGLKAEDNEVMQRLIQPVPGIYTCNEAYSDMQGWVNGSLRSADLVLGAIGVAPLVDTEAPCQPPADTTGR